MVQRKTFHPAARMPNGEGSWSLLRRIKYRALGLAHRTLGGCPRIESLLRKSGFWSIFPIKCVKYSQYSPYLIEKMVSKPLSLATTPVLGQPPSYLILYGTDFSVTYKLTRYFIAD